MKTAAVVGAGVCGAAVYDENQNPAEGVFASVNVHVHDLVDFVTEKNMKASAAAVRYIKEGYIHGQNCITIEHGDSISYSAPQRLDLFYGEEGAVFCFRVDRGNRDAAIEAVDEFRRVVYHKNVPT